jgi:hypothetical protein
VPGSWGFSSHLHAGVRCRPAVELGDANRERREASELQMHLGALGRRQDGAGDAPRVAGRQRLDEALFPRLTVDPGDAFSAQDGSPLGGKGEPRIRIRPLDDRDQCVP